MKPHRPPCLPFFASLCAAVAMCATAIAAEDASPREQLTDQQRQIDQLGDDLDGLDDITMRQPTPPGGNTATPGIPATDTYKGTVTLKTDGRNGTGATPGPGSWPVTLTLKKDPKFPVWHLNIRSDDPSIPGTGQLDGHRPLRASGTKYSHSTNIPGYREAYNIEVGGDTMSGTISFQADRRDDVEGYSLDYSIQATRVRP